MKRSLPTLSPNSDARVIEQVRRHLNFPAGWTPRVDLGETATSLQVWSPAELDALYTRVGGEVTLRQTGRTVETTLTTPVPGVGPVVVTTEWEPAIHPEQVGLPVLQAVAAPGGV